MTNAPGLPGDHESPPVLLPSPFKQLLVWTRLGVQSFGGGTATLSLVRRAVVDEQQWITPEEFARYWALVLMAPGINLLGLIILIGRKIGGVLGVVIALAGLLFPSVTITILLTALYSRFQHSPLVAHAVKGLIPATVGVGIVTGLQIAQPVFKRSLKIGTRSFLVASLVFAGSALVEFLLHWPVIAILLTSGIIGALSQFVGAPKHGGE